MVATRNISLEPVVDAHVQSWVTVQINASMNRVRDELLEAIQSALGGNNGRSHGEGTNRGGQPQFTRMTKLEFPKFGGDDFRGWLYKYEQFFEIDHVADPHKVQIASLHLVDIASLWHRQFVRLLGANVSWNSFKEAILLRFGNVFEDPIADIKNLRHTSTIGEYQNAFDMLLSTTDLPEDQQISFYIAGLQNDVQLAVKMFRPKSLAEAYHLSKIQETQIKESRQRYKKYTPGHSYRGQVFNLEVVADLEEEIVNCEEEVQEEATREVIEYTPQISLNALNGVESFQTIRVTGHIGKHQIHILIDCGSTHYFLDLEKAKQLGCAMSSTCPLQLDILGGAKLLSTLGNIQFDFKALKMEFQYEGRKMVLRRTKKPALQWMKGSQVPMQSAQLSSMVLCVYPSTSLNMIFTATSEGTPTPMSISKVLSQYTDVFAITTALPPMRAFDYKIILKEGTEPTFSKPYRHSPSQKDAIGVMLKELLESRVIRHSQSPFSSPVVMVKKKDGTWRMFMPFGLTNALSTFQALMNSVFKQYLRKFVLVFFDDILVYNPDLKSHVQHLEIVLQLMRTHTLFAKQSKCMFGAKRVKYLGYVITSQGVAIDETKIEAMQNWPTPTNLKQLRGFLGLTGYYRWFIKNYASISQPLTKLMKKNAFQWSSEAQSAFLELKEAMMSAPVLRLPNFREVFMVETDASREGIGARITTPAQMKWLPKLIGFDFEIAYKKGCDDGAADALSRVNTGGQLLQMLLSTVSTDLLSKIVGSWTTDPPEYHDITFKRWYMSGENLKSGVNGCHLQNIGATLTSIHPLKLPPLRLCMVNHPLYLFCILLAKAQARMKAAADVHKSDRSFEVGQWVWLKLQPHRQILVRKEKYNKLLPTYYGPFQVTAKIFKGDPLSVSPVLPQCDPNGNLVCIPVKVLGRKMVKVNNKMVIYVLVQWSNGTIDDAT
nr:hypothetical protein [Tanacetum cinerariifolium]